MLDKLRCGNIDTRNASYRINENLWEILTECAKIFSTMIANARLADGCSHPWVGTPWENVLLRHLDVVQMLVNSYPQWTPDAMRPLQDIWQALGTDLFKCRFVEGEKEDSVVAL